MGYVGEKWRAYKAKSDRKKGYRQYAKDSAKAETKQDVVEDPDIDQIEPEKPPFDIKKANNKDFVKFVHEVYGDAQEFNPSDDLEGLESRYEAFENRNTVVKEMQTLYSEQLKGILDPKEVAAAVQKHIDKEIKDDPEAMAEYVKDLKDIRESERKLKLHSDNVSKLLKRGGSDLKEKAAAMDKYESNTSWAKPWKWWSKETQQIKKDLQDKYKVDLAKFDEECAKTMELMSKVGFQEQEYKNVVDKYEDVRVKLFREMNLAEDLTKQAQKKLIGNARAILKKPGPKTLKDLESLYEHFERGEGDGEHGIERVAVSHPDGADMFIDKMESLDNAIDKRMAADIKEIIKKTDFAKVSEKLKPLFERTKLGSKTGAEAKERIREMVSDSLEKLKGDPMKSFMLRILLEQYKE